MKQKTTTRRSLLVGITTLATGFSQATMATAAFKTPRATEGPYYPKPSMRLPDIDNDLVKVAGLVERAGGEIFTLRGTLMNREGGPLAGHRIEIWQSDMNGKYLHTGDRRSVPYDQAFQGFGFDITDEAGGYVFRTIKPGIYPGRTPHIHVKVLSDERELLISQFYIKGHTDNARDSLYSRMSEFEADSVSMAIVAGEDGLQATVNVVV